MTFQPDSMVKVLGLDGDGGSELERGLRETVGNDQGGDYQCDYRSHPAHPPSAPRTTTGGFLHLALSTVGVNLGRSLPYVGRSWRW